MTRRVTLITGGGRGIGAACAKRFAAGGARVAVLARTGAEIDAVAREIGGLAVPCDVSDEDAVEVAVSRVRAALGPIEILVNNAGVVVRHTVDGHPTAAWDQVLATNLRGPFLLTRAALPDLIAVGDGRVVNVSSISGRVGTPGLAAYCASKWGLIGFTKALAEEVKGRGVVVTAICPGSVDTDMLRSSGLDFEPDMTPADVAEAVYFLATCPAAVAGAALDWFG